MTRPLQGKPLLRKRLAKKFAQIAVDEKSQIASIGLESFGPALSKMFIRNRDRKMNTKANITLEEKKAEVWYYFSKDVRENYTGAISSNLKKLLTEPLEQEEGVEAENSEEDEKKVIDQNNDDLDMENFEEEEKYNVVERDEQPRRRRRKRQRVLTTIRQLQKSTALQIPPTRFRRLVREILATTSIPKRIQSSAVEALQESAESYLVMLFENAEIAKMHAHRHVLMPKDLQLALRLSSTKENELRIT